MRLFQNLKKSFFLDIINKKTADVREAHTAGGRRSPGPGVLCRRPTNASLFGPSIEPTPTLALNYQKS